MDSTLKYAGREVTFYDLANDSIQDQFAAGYWHELETLEFIRSLDVTGNYVDIGANIGGHSLFMALFCKAEKVFAFEPQTDLFEKLCTNATHNLALNLFARNVALSDKSGIGVMYSVNRGNRGGGMLKLQDLPWRDSWNCENAIFVARLDDLALPNVKLMKVDVEGHEFQVLKGAERTLSTVDHLVVEVWSKHAGCDVKPWIADRSADTVSYLASLGLHYRRTLPGDAGNWYFSRRVKCDES